MDDVIAFGGDLDMYGPPAMLRTIFRYIRHYAGNSEELQNFALQEEIFDAQGGWDFDTLTLEALKKLQSIIGQLEADLPGAISDWSEPYRPRFYVKFPEFKKNLADRIAQLQEP